LESIGGGKQGMILLPHFFQKNQLKKPGISYHKIGLYFKASFPQ
jgi:hypothetical protein